MTLTLSPLEAISRTKKRDTLKTNVFIWGGRIAPGSRDEHTRPGSLEPEVLLLPPILICRFPCYCVGSRRSSGCQNIWQSFPWPCLKGMLWFFAFTASGDKDSYLCVLIRVNATQPTLLRRSSCVPWLESHPQKNSKYLWKYLSFVAL